MTAASPALHHKLLANAAGRLGDFHADARDDARATGNEALAQQHAALARLAYAEEEVHLTARQASGASLGGKQPSAKLAAAYAAAQA